MWFFRISIALLVFKFPALILAQPKVNPDVFSIEDGLSQGYISCIHQDSEGFMWFGTKNGLNLYDGRSFETYTTDHTNPYAISNDFILDIIEEGDFMLIATHDGLNIFHKISERFYKIPNPKIIEESNLSWITKDIKRDKLGQYWLIDDRNRNVWQMKLPESFWSSFQNNENVLNKIEFRKLPQSPVSSSWLSNDDVSLITSDDKCQFWKTDINTLLSIDISIKEELIDKEKGFNYSLPLNSDTVLFMTFGSKDPNLDFDRDIKVWQHDKWQTIGKLIDSELNPWYYISIDQSILLYENYEPKAYIFEKRNLNWEKLKFREADFYLNSDGIRFISALSDNSGNLWLGTNGQGIQKIAHRNQHVATMFEANSIYQIPYMFNDGTIVVSDPTIVGGVFRNKSNSLLDDSGFMDLLNTSTEFIIWDGNNDSKWLYCHGSEERYYGSNVFYIDSMGSFDRVPVVKSKNTLSSFHQEITTELCCFAGGHEIMFHHPISGEISKVNMPDILGQEEITVYHIETTANGDWWLGTSVGLVQMTPKTRPNSLIPEFTYRRHHVDQNPNSNRLKGLLNNEVATLLADPADANVLWIGTKGGGLHKLDTRSMNMSYLTTKNGLPNDVIYGLLSDDDGRLWMSSNKGIIRYDPQTHEIRNYTKADGLQGDEFNTWAYGKTHKGELVFGGVNGLNVFHPSIFLDNAIAPVVKMTNLKVNNQKIEAGDSTKILDRSFTFTEEIRLPFSKNNLSMQFAALEFTAPKKNKFRYYLEGSEEPWTHVSTNNEAQYLNVKPGTYIFKIKASNGDGVWSDQVTQLNITILPPWYRSLLAYAIYGALLTLGIWQLFNLQKRRIQLRYEIEAEQKEKKQLKALDRAKSKLYTNITHEFRTPLTVIAGMTDQIEGNAEKKKLIKRNSDQLLNLVNQMLDLRKIESGSITFHNKHGDIAKFLRYLTESLKSYAEKKGLMIHFISDEDSLMMDFDAEKITRIHSNLLSNAIKFTPDGGNIYIQLDKENASSNLHSSQSSNSTLDHNNNAVLTIRDTGVGIAEDQFSLIFERFYQVDADSEKERSVVQAGGGTGIGLTLVAELINAMQGEIQVKSKVGKGTTFIIRLPITNEANPSDESVWKVERSAELVAATQPDNFNFKEAEVELTDKPSVLIVEDNPDVIHYLIALLKSDYSIDIAMNGEEGIEKALDEIPDIIVSDVMMPVKDGFELCETLKTDERSSHIPIVLLTAKADFEARLQGLHRGADAYLNKPFHQEELLQILKNLLELRKRLQSKLMNINNLAASDEIIFLEEEQASVQYHLEIEDVFLEKIRSFIEKDISDTNIGLPQLIRNIGMSRSQIYKKVKALTGVSPTHYIRSIRLYHAQHLLKTTTLNISEIAYSVGFSTPSYFSAAFLEEFGITPSETRN